MNPFDFLFNSSRLKLEKAHEYFHSEQYQEALNLYEQVINNEKSNSSEVCEAWYCIGESYYANNRKLDALVSFENAISIGKPQDNIFAYHAQGKTFRILLESELLNDKTEGCGRDLCNNLYSLYLKYPQNTDIKRLLANSLGNYATYTRQVGKVKDSVKIHTESLKLTDDTRGNCIGYKQLGLSLLMAGDAENAKLAFEKSMTYSYILPDGESLITNILYDYGLALHSIGRYSEAIQKFEESKERAFGDTIGELYAENGLGIVYQSIGLPDEAEKKFSLIDSSISGISEDFRANNLYHLCRVKLFLGKISEASSIAEKIVRIGENSNKITHILNGILLKSKIFELNKQWIASSEILLEGLNLVSTTEDIVKLINLTIEYAYSLVHINKIEEAQNKIEEAFHLSVEIDTIETKIKSLTCLGYVHYIKNEHLIAENKLLEAIRLSEDLRNENEFNIQAFTAIQDTYYSSIILIQNIYIKRGDNEKALIVNDCFKFRNVKGNIKSNINFDDRDIIIDAKTICAEEKCVIFINSLSYLDPYTLKDPIIRTWCISKDDFMFVERKYEQFSENWQNKEIALIDSRGIMRFNDGTNNDLMILSNILIQPFEKVLNRSPMDKLIFVPDASMSLVPFSALQMSNGKSLIEENEIQITHSLSHLIQVKQNQNTSIKDDNIMVIGNPITNLSYAQNLPYAEEEAKYIASLYENNYLLTGADATKQNFIDNIDKYSIIHIASHSWGEYDTMKGFVGNIFLAPNAVYPNGIVDANEIVEKKLTNKLIVLSSCKSSLGSLRSSGMLGLSMSFLLSGSKNVISSLWSVNDKSTFFLMKEFYNSLLETDNYSKALKEAILLTKKAYPNYLDWAGFYLYI